MPYCNTFVTQRRFKSCVLLFAYYNLGKSQLAIDDYNRAIRINPDYAGAYVIRGFVKKKLGEYYCDDYKKACELGEKRACSWFSSQCK